MAEPKMTIRLDEDNELLDEVVVVGYSTQRKVDITGAITSVDVKEIAKQNENNPITNSTPTTSNLSRFSRMRLPPQSTVRARPTA